MATKKTNRAKSKRSAKAKTKIAKSAKSRAGKLAKPAQKLKKSKAGKSAKPERRRAAKAKTTPKKAAAPKKAAGRKKAAPQKLPAKAKSGLGKSAAGKKTPAKTIGARAASKARRDQDVPLDSLDTTPNVSGLESGDLEGLSNDESADSESVDELLEEGNAFEAGIVAGIEGSRGREGQEIRTREVPEDDVPEEYLNQD